MEKEFSGSLAFVTGGAGGIGERICSDLATEGASVIVADLQSKAAFDLAASLPTGDSQVHLGIQLDVSKKAEVEEALRKVIETYRQPADLIVNCAGVGGVWYNIEDVPEDYLDKLMAVNFKGTFLVTQVFGKALLDAKKPGSIVNISSRLAYICFPGVSPYCASKAAVMQFTKVAAKEWGPNGIRVNSVHPGLIDTPLSKNYKASFRWDEYARNASLRRVGQPKDVSDVVLFALSNRSKFVTGVQIDVSGQGPIQG